MEWKVIFKCFSLACFIDVDSKESSLFIVRKITQIRFVCFVLQGSQLTFQWSAFDSRQRFRKSSIRLIGQNYHCLYFVPWIFGGLLWCDFQQRHEPSHIFLFLFLFFYFPANSNIYAKPSNAHWIVLVVLVLSLVLFVSVNWRVKAQPSPVVQSVCWEPRIFRCYYVARSTQV